MKLEYDQALSAGMKIIFIDEAIFSSTTSLKRSWSQLNMSIEIPDVRTKIKTYAVIAGISTDLGLESYMIREQSFN